MTTTISQDLKNQFYLHTNVNKLLEFNDIIEQCRRAGKLGGGDSSRYIWECRHKLNAILNSFSLQNYEKCYQYGVSQGWDMAWLEPPSVTALMPHEAKALNSFY